MRTKEELVRVAEQVLEFCNNVQKCGATKEDILQFIDAQLANARHGVFRDKLPIIPAELALLKGALLMEVTESKYAKETVVEMHSGREGRAEKVEQEAEQNTGAKTKRSKGKTAGYGPEPVSNG